jgi:hypothetical protein
MLKLVYTELNTTYLLGDAGDDPENDYAITGMIDPRNGYQIAKCLPAAKYADYFTEALPNTQKGQAPNITIDISAIPVYPHPEIFDIRNLPNYDPNGTKMATVNNTPFTHQMLGRGDTQSGASQGYVGTVSAQSESVAADKVYFKNLYAEGTSTIAQSINEIRLAFQTQKLLEKLARGGSRYNEIIMAEFGVHLENDRQRPELIAH